MTLSSVSASTGPANLLSDRGNLVVRDLVVSYGQRQALVDVNLNLAPGQLVALLGPNGAGKSTLLRAILGLLPVVRGSVELAGRPVRRQLNALAYVPQRENVNWEFPVTVGDVALMGRYPHLGWFRRPNATDREAVDRALDQVGMLTFRNRQIGELSGGQQQRVFLARALAQEAAVLLLDEPLASVDATSSETMLAVLRQLAEAGKLVLMAIHDFGLASSRVDRVIFLRQTVVAVGTPSEVFNRTTLQRVYGASVFLIEEDQTRFVLVGDDPHGH